MRIVIWSLCLCFSLSAQGAELHSFLPDPATGSAGAVRVEGPAALVHTAQLFPTSVNAGVIGQAESLLLQIDHALQEGGSSLSRMVRLNVYVTKGEYVAPMQKVLARTFASDFRPAVTWVTSALPQKEDVLIAADAVGLVTTNPPAAKKAATKGFPSQRRLAEGTRVYISGQAEKGDGSMADATRKTLESLGGTLDFLGLTRGDVVQMKAFLTPMTAIGDAEKEVAAFFGTVRPVCSYVEWESTLPIEIELVVSAAGQAALAKGPALEIRTPPEMKPSPVFSRLAIVRHPDTLYTGSVFARDPSTPAEMQMRTVFSTLKKLLDAGESDWVHLAKATYYVSAEDVSAAHNALRPDYFSPTRPPAASKAKVKGVGPAEHRVNLDMIAVPGE